MFLGVKTVLCGAKFRVQPKKPSFFSSSKNKKKAFLDRKKKVSGRRTARIVNSAVVALEAATTIEFQVR